MENLVQIIIWWAVIWFTLKFLGNALLTFINKDKRKSFTDNVKKPIPKEIKLGMLAPLLVIIVWVVLYYNSSLQSMQGIGVFIVCIFVIGIVEFILNALFKKGSEDRQFVMMLFNPKFLAKGGWVIWLCLGLWAWLFFLI